MPSTPEVTASDLDEVMLKSLADAGYDDVEVVDSIIDHNPEHGSNTEEEMV